MLRLAYVLFGIVIFAGVSPGADKPVRVTAIFAMDADGGNVRELASIPDYPIINFPEILQSVDLVAHGLAPWVHSAFALRKRGDFLAQRPCEPLR